MSMEVFNGMFILTWRHLR